MSKKVSVLDPDPSEDLPFPDSKHPLSSQFIFEEFFESIQSLYWFTTHGMYRLRSFGMDPTQEVLVNLSRYQLQKLLEAYRKHPLYHDYLEVDE